MTRPFDFYRQNAPWLLAGLLLTFGSSFGQTYFIAIFADDIRADFGLSHGGWGGVYAGATMTSAAVMVWAGGLTDRFRVRVLGAGLLIGLAIAALAMASASAIWALAGAVFLLRLMGQGVLSHSAMVGMARWFVATRGRAIAFAGLGFALGEALLPLTFVLLKTHLPWRGLWLIAAGLLVVLAVVLILLLRRERTPQSFAESGGSLGMAGRNWTRAQVLRQGLFWLMLPALLGPGAWITAFFFHQVHFAEAKGWTHLHLVALFPIYTAAGIAAMVGSGWLVDRLGSTRLAGWHLLPLALGFVLVGQAQGTGLAALALVLMGLSVGANSTLSASLWAEVYGTLHLGRIRAMLGAIMVLGSALGPGISGLLIDQGIDMPAQAVWIGAYFAAAALLGALGCAGARRLMQGQAGQTP